jgi:streptogramin lyase
MNLKCHPLINVKKTNMNKVIVFFLMSLLPVTVMQAANSPQPQAVATEIELIAGGGTAVEGAPARQCKISQPFGIAFDAQDNMFICEETHRLLRVDAKTGVLTVVSGAKKTNAPLGDGGPVQQASFTAPHNLVADAQGNLFVADTYHYAVRRVDAKTGMVTTFAGTGVKELSGDGGQATSASLDGIACLCFNHDFTKLYLGGFSKVIRVVVVKTGVISTVSGIGGSRAMAVDSKGNLFTAAGRGLRMLGVDGKSRSLEDPTAQPVLKGVKHLWADRDDNILIADAGNHLIRKFVVSQQKLLPLAGTGTKGAAGVPGPALQAQLGEPHGVTTHPRTGDIYIADSRNHRVLRIKLKQ